MRSSAGLREVVECGRMHRGQAARACLEEVRKQGHGSPMSSVVVLRGRPAYAGGTGGPFDKLPSVERLRVCDRVSVPQRTPRKEREAERDFHFASTALRQGKRTMVAGWRGEVEEEGWFSRPSYAQGYGGQGAAACLTAGWNSPTIQPVGARLSVGSMTHYGSKSIGVSVRYPQ